MTPDELKTLQTPLKEQYRAEPSTALATLRAIGEIDLPNIACPIQRRPGAPSVPGLHPMAGGGPQFACAAEMLLEALVGCAGVTFAAVCTAMEIPLEQARLIAEGDLDFRGTLGVDRSVPIGFLAVRLRFEINSPSEDAKLDKAVQLAERYCVVAQTLKQVTADWTRISEGE